MGQKVSTILVDKYKQDISKMCLYLLILKLLGRAPEIILTGESGEIAGWYPSDLKSKDVTI